MFVLEYKFVIALSLIVFCVVIFIYLNSGNNNIEIIYSKEPENDNILMNDMETSSIYNTIIDKQNINKISQLDYNAS
jgi:hypothetical protein